MYTIVPHGDVDENHHLIDPSTNLPPSMLNVMDEFSQLGLYAKEQSSGPHTSSQIADIVLEGGYYEIGGPGSSWEAGVSVHPESGTSQSIIVYMTIDMNVSSMVSSKTTTSSRPS